MLPPTMARPIHRRYDDPVDLVWLSCARACGLAVARSSAVFAAYDGAGTLTVSSSEHFDADDSLAQLIFHELCHGLVAGPAGASRRDWGLENLDGRDLVAEHACHRLQHALATRFGLRGLLSVTTEHRTYWDALPDDALATDADPAIEVARAAWERATSGPWAQPLHDALAATRAIAQIVRQGALPEESVWHADSAPIVERGCADDRV